MTLHLSFMLWLPLASGVLALLVPRRVAGWIALLGSACALAYAVAYVIDFKSGGGLQHVTDEMWISELGIHYKLGVDGLNLFLVLLTTVLFTASMLWSALEAERDRQKQYFFHLSLAHTAVLGALLAQDLALFVVFFDLMLVPVFFLTGIWGGPERIPAITKLFIYTLVGSLLMLAAAVATGVLAAPESGISFALSDLRENALADGTQRWIFLCFAAAFLVKMPAFPLHGWMPDAYTSTPIPVLVLLSGVLSKVGAYGFLAIVLPIMPQASHHFQELMIVVAVVSILYGSALAFTSDNTRLVVGYSSVAQLGFITLGIFALDPKGTQGAIIQMLNHGLVVAPLFLIIAALAARSRGAESLREMGGVAFRAPVLAGLFLIVALATLAMPGSSNFAGELLILFGIFDQKLAYGIVASVGVVLASVYMIRFYQRSMHNRVGADVESRDLALPDLATIVPLVGVILALSIYPQIVLQRSEPTTTAILNPSGLTGAYSLTPTGPPGP